MTAKKFFAWILFLPWGINWVLVALYMQLTYPLDDLTYTQRVGFCLIKLLMLGLAGGCFWAWNDCKQE